MTHSPIQRRSLMRGAVWSAPAVMATTAIPAYAASAQTCQDFSSLLNDMQTSTTATGETVYTYYPRTDMSGYTLDLVSYQDVLDLIKVTINGGPRPLGTVKQMDDGAYMTSYTLDGTIDTFQMTVPSDVGFLPMIAHPQCPPTQLVTGSWAGGSIRGANGMNVSTTINPQEVSSTFIFPQASMIRSIELTMDQNLGTWSAIVPTTTLSNDGRTITVTGSNRATYTIKRSREVKNYLMTAIVTMNDGTTRKYSYTQSFR